MFPKLQFQFVKTFIENFFKIRCMILHFMYTRNKELIHPFKTGHSCIQPNIKVSLPLYLGCHFISKLSPLPEGSAQNAIVCIPPQLLHILPLQNKCIRKPIYFLLRNSNVTDPLRYQAEEIQHVCIRSAYAGKG